VLPIKRKFRSAVWRLNQATIRAHYVTIKYVVELMTNKYWLLDYLPTFLRPKQGVLLVRLDLIGDFILWLDSAQTYRDLYPSKKVTLFVNSACKELAETLPHWDEVIGVNVHLLRTNYLYRLRILTRLRWLNFAVAIQPTFSRELAGDLALRASFAPERIGYEGDLNNIDTSIKNNTDNWYTKLIGNEPKQTMELNINAHFVRALGCHKFLSSIANIPKIALQRRAEIELEGPYAIVAPGASWTRKQWPIEQFSKLAQELVAQKGIKIALCGSSHDFQLCEQIAKVLPANCALNLAGKTTLTEYVEIIRSATLLVCNDSAPIHIAAATQTPAVCILGGGHFGRFLPYKPEVDLANSQVPLIVTNRMECFGCKWVCTVAPAGDDAVPCIKFVSVSDVYSSCIDAISSSKRVHESP
jgi:ADP-heptose:LPS heptosyltransferase